MPKFKANGKTFDIFGMDSGAGGRNLLLARELPSSETAGLGGKMLRLEPNNTGAISVQVLSYNLIPGGRIIPGRTYTVSFWAVSELGSTEFTCDFRPDNVCRDVGVSATQTPSHYAITWTLEESVTDKTNLWLRFFRLREKPNYAVRIWDIMVEEGEIAHTYMPAPEDLASS